MVNSYLFHTFMQTKQYSFQQQDLLGKQGEQILDDWLSFKYQIIDVSHILQYQTSGIDRLLIHPSGFTLSVEYKFDKAAARTGNLFFETTSVDTTGILGWGWSSQADYWIFLVPDNDIYIVKPSDFRLLVWQKREQLKEKHIQNCGYRTIGFPVKIADVKNISCRVTDKNVAPPLLDRGRKSP